MIISNTTPLINYSSIQRLDILEKLFHQIIIPEAVEYELLEKTGKFPTLEQLKYCNFIKTIPIKDIRLFNSIKRELDNGEAEAITLAIEHQAELILLDELNGRHVAQYHNLNFTGTIGCLIQAKKQGLISNIKEPLDLVRDQACFWINEKLYQRILFDNHEK